MSEPLDKDQILALSDLRGRVVIITGAGQGIGRTFAHAFAAAGAIAVIAERNRENGEAVVREIKDRGGRAASIETDVTSASAAEAMAAEAFRQFGRIDALINNAGLFSGLKMRPFEEIPLDEWEAVMKVNVTGVMICCRAVLPYMREAGFGRIINMSSASIMLGRPNYLHYTTSKAAVIGMTRSLARELGPFGITANAMMPGAVTTEIPRETVTPEQRARIVSMQCVPRAQVPEDLVGVALFLASEGSRFLTGQTLNVDGGATHL